MTDISQLHPSEAFAIGILAGLQTDVVAVPRTFVKLCGGNFGYAGLLAQIFYWNRPEKSNGDPDRGKLTIYKEGRWWLSKSEKEWDEEIGITASVLKSGLKFLAEMGLIEVKPFLFNNKRTRHIWLNKKALLAALMKLLNVAQPKQPESDDGQGSGEDGDPNTQRISPDRNGEKPLTGTVKTHGPITETTQETTTSSLRDGLSEGKEAGAVPEAQQGKTDQDTPQGGGGKKRKRKAKKTESDLTPELKDDLKKVKDAAQLTWPDLDWTRKMAVIKMLVGDHFGFQIEGPTWKKHKLEDQMTVDEFLSYCNFLRNHPKRPPSPPYGALTNKTWVNTFRRVTQAASREFRGGDGSNTASLNGLTKRKKPQNAYEKLLREIAYVQSLIESTRPEDTGILEAHQDKLDMLNGQLDKLLKKMNGGVVA